MTRFRIAFALTFLLLSVSACARGDDAEPDRTGAAGESGTVVEVVARGLTFTAPDQVPTGWITFRFRNESPMTHFAVVERMPEGHGMAAQQEEVAPVFQQGMDLLDSGDADAAMEKFGELPAWFGDIVFVGGPGLTGPQHTSQATVYLEPGTYLLECYVKTDGIFHSYNPDPNAFGMVHELEAVGEPSEAPEPTADVRLTVSSDNGIQVEGDPQPGEITVAVHFADQTVHENFVGHDVHLVRLSDGINLDALEQWMDWTRPDGLQTPAPVEFLGGVNEMPAGSTGYLTVQLEPGDYAWISEVPRSGEKGMLKTFSVSSS